MNIGNNVDEKFVEMIIKQVCYARDHQNHDPVYKFTDGGLKSASKQICEYFKNRLELNEDDIL